MLAYWEVNSMQRTKRLLESALVATAVFQCLSAHASTESAKVHSIYFRRASDFSSDPSNNYAAHWRGWLQYHRAVGQVPGLRRHILRLPADPYEGRKGALRLIHSRLPLAFVRS